MDHRKVARDIQEAFGPCTVAYECYEVEEIARRLERNTPQEMAETFMLQEEREMEHSGGYIEDADRHKKFWDSWKERRANIVARLTQLGINL